MPDSDSSDPGSTPGIPTKRFVLSSNRLGRHPFTVKTYGFEPRRHDRLGHSAAASTPDFDSGGPGSSPGAPTILELWQTWCMRRTEASVQAERRRNLFILPRRSPVNAKRNPKNVVQFREAPL